MLWRLCPVAQLEPRSFSTPRAGAGLCERDPLVWNKVVRAEGRPSQSLAPFWAAAWRIRGSPRDFRAVGQSTHDMVPDGVGGEA